MQKNPIPYLEEARWLEQRIKEQQLLKQRKLAGNTPPATSTVDGATPNTGASSEQGSVPNG